MSSADNNTAAQPTDTVAALGPDTVAAVRDAVRRQGIAPVARKLGVDRSALTRVLAGLPVRRGTAALVRLSAASLHAPALAIAAPSVTNL